MFACDFMGLRWGLDIEFFKVEWMVYIFEDLV